MSNTLSTGVSPAGLPPRTLRLRIAHSISAILSPPVVSIPTILLVALYRTSNQLQAIGYTLLTLFFVSVGPMLYILIGVKLGKFTDMDVSKRSQRVGPFIICLLSVLAVFSLLGLIHGPHTLQTALLMTLFIGCIMMLVTLWGRWKISIHASSLAGAVTLLTALYGQVVLPAYALVALVCWSRVVLHRHTTGQVIAGSLVTIGIAALTLALYGI
ncbi:hypothetical protein KSD_20690 [Ktedonobacter sp. SOSP1-85]|uniref:Phosphoesterase PA-phosphatase related protein n=1 Tax=Ktedonobacter racemifer DSM 44963 TaxID=485913 RepID=D6TEK4_KTERA|nr:MULTISPECIES: hypothetical protein [Ktedonobacter]EFH90377.1 phosphoesterase PA-phosphatase related protein [Ktedonobacter racemifer DSM 44963]GHO74298.1 hypothetical protein KSD_20690 [Ktedonobacter sp. SOSP1-85]